MRSGLETSKDKIIFIDIDGVLTNVEDESSYLCGKPERYRISEKNMNNLMKILSNDLKRTGVVVASNWRRHADTALWSFEGKKYQNQLPRFREMLGNLIVGDLPHDRPLTKSEALELWFEDNEWMSKRTGKYVIFDDDLREGYQEHPLFSKHFIYTNWAFGLENYDVDHALKILS